MKNLQVIVAAFLAIYLALYLSTYMSPVYLPGIFISLPVPSCLHLESSPYSISWQSLFSYQEELKTGIGFLEMKVRDMICTVLTHYQIQHNFIQGRYLTREHPGCLPISCFVLIVHYLFPGIFILTVGDQADGCNKV